MMRPAARAGRLRKSAERTRRCPAARPPDIDVPTSSLAGHAVDVSRPATVERRARHGPRGYHGAMDKPYTVRTARAACCALVAWAVLAASAQEPPAAPPVHDPANSDFVRLQKPSEAFAGLPRDAR